MHHRWILSSAVIFGLGCNRPDSEQPVVHHPDSTYVVSDKVSCPRCRIELDTLALIKGTSRANFFLSTRVAFLPDVKMYAAAPLLEMGQVAIYDSTGKFLKLLLRQGEGPGELTRVRFMIPQGGSRLLVTSYGGKSVLVDLATEAHTDIQLPPSLTPEDVAPFGHGRTLANTVAPLFRTGVVLDSGGKLERTFGDSVRLLPDGRWSILPTEMLVRLGRVGSNAAMVTRKFRIHYSEWDTTGAQALAFDRPAAWYRSYTQADQDAMGTALPSQKPPLPEMTAVYGDSAGRIWLVATVADSAWAQQDPYEEGKSLMTVSSGGIPTLPDRDWKKFVDGVIEVIDRAKLTVLSRLRTPFYFERALGPGYLAAVDQDADGAFQFRVFRARLVTP